MHIGPITSETATHLTTSGNSLGLFDDHALLPSTSQELPHSQIIPALTSLHTLQNLLDREMDTADLCQLMWAALQTTSDVEMLEVLQIGHQEMPDAIKTLQCALEHIMERDNKYFAPQGTKRMWSESITTDDDMASTVPKTKRCRIENIADQASAGDSIISIQHPQPVGMKWSENSCAYDSVFTILFNIWQRDHQWWSLVLEQLGNGFCTLFIEEFERYRRKEMSLEAGRDIICRELGKVNRFLHFGEYTSIEQVCHTIFSTSEVVYEVYYQRPSHHRLLYSWDNSIFISNNFTYRSMSRWMETNSWQGTNLCQVCGLRVRIETNFTISTSSASIRIFTLWHWNWSQLKNKCSQRSPQIQPSRHCVLQTRRKPFCFKHSHGR